MENPEKKENKLFKSITSINANVSVISWILLILLIVNVFSSNEVEIREKVEVKEQDISTYGVKKPKTYCSDEGILYWINGVVTIDSQKQYILSVVYDNNQKPKKCEFK